MSTKGRKILAGLPLFLFVAGALGIATHASPALASQSLVTCAPILLESSPAAGGGTVIVQCPGIVNYYGVVSAPSGCQSTNVDTLKVWASMTQSAILAGKSMNIWYQT